MNAYQSNIGEAFDIREFRQTLGQFATGVTVISTSEGGEVHGMTANSFTSVSLEPPLILVSIDNRARMKDFLKRTGVFGLSILSEHQQPVSQHFAGKPQDDMADPFVWRAQVPVIDEALAKLVCDVEYIYPAGDHTLFIGLVRHFERSLAEPLIFHGGSYSTNWWTT
ncbi:MAG: flavin reductase family protein [Pseudomonadales bacterium]